MVERDLGGLAVALGQAGASSVRASVKKVFLHSVITLLYTTARNCWLVITQNPLSHPQFRLRTLPRSVSKTSQSQAFPVERLVWQCLSHCH